MIYHDGTHIVADSLAELNEFAEKMGIKRYWFHGVKKGRPHAYPLSNAYRGDDGKNTHPVWIS